MAAAPAAAMPAHRALANRPAASGRDHRRLRDRWGDPEIEHPLLIIGQQPVRFLEEQAQLGLVTR